MENIAAVQFPINSDAVAEMTAQVTDTTVSSGRESASHRTDTVCSR